MTLLQGRPSHWSSGEAFLLRVACLGLIPAFSPGFFSRWSHTSDLKLGTPVAMLPGKWRYRVNAGTGWPGVSMLLGEIAGLICKLCVSVSRSVLEIHCVPTNNNKVIMIALKGAIRDILQSPHCAVNYARTLKWPGRSNPAGLTWRRSP